MCHNPTKSLMLNLYQWHSKIVTSLLSWSYEISRFMTFCWQTVLFKTIFLSDAECLCKRPLQERWNLPNWFYWEGISLPVYICFCWTWLWTRQVDSFKPNNDDVISIDDESLSLNLAHQKALQVILFKRRRELGENRPISLILPKISQTVCIVYTLF